MIKNKNKIIFISSISIIISSNTIAFGDVDINAENRSGFYIRANIGANKINNAREVTEDTSIKSESNISPTFSFGFGGYINSYVRTDLTFNYSKVKFKKGKASGSFREYDDDYDRYYSGTYNSFLDREASIYALMLNNYIDLPITEKTNFFVGGGVGLARIKEEISYTWSAIGWPTINVYTSTRNKNNIAYSLTTGLSTKVNTITTIELAYSYKNFGKTHYKNDQYGKADSNRYKGHFLTLGIRFDV